MMSEANAVTIFLDSDKKHEAYEAVELDLAPGEAQPEFAVF